MNYRGRLVGVVFVILLLFAAAAAQDNAKQTDAGVASDEATRAVRYTPPEKTSAFRPHPIDPLWKAYYASLEHVSVWRNEDVRRLKPLTVAADGTVEVATATKYPVTSPLYGDTWVTLVPELLNACRQFTGDVAMQVRELLGLPPDHQIPTIVVMKVQPSDVFRPTPDPTPWTLCPCGDPASSECNFAPQVQCGNRFPSDVTPTYVQWFANTTLSVRQVPGGFPWTHLGYTYNWKPGADHYGASEYIVRKGSSVSDIRTSPLEDYCKR